MYYSEEIIAEVQQRNDIVDIISQYVRLQKKGSNYIACCPFHTEKTPSFSVSRTKQMYKCFGCGEGGSVITFLQKYENLSFPEAIKYLADRAGVQLPESQQSEAAKKRDSRRARLLEVNKAAAGYYFYLLRSDKGKVGMDYLERRGLTEETRHKFGLGYASSYGNDLITYLKQKGYSDSDIKDAGLASFSEQKGISSKFWNRVMFPIQDSNHRVIGFGGRVMGDGEPKYLNSPETEIFDKSRNLYGLNFARTAKKPNMILCEGYMDVISLHQAGFDQAVASLGTAFTDGQANLLRRYTKDVLLAYDSDGAGIKAALRAIGILRQNGLSGKIINMQPYKDPDEFIRNLGTEEFQKRIDEAENSFLFRVRIAERDYQLKDPDSRTRFFREVATMICEFEEEVERESYMEAVAERYRISKNQIKELVVKHAMSRGGVTVAERPKPASSNQGKQRDHVKHSQQLLLTYLADKPELYQKVKKYLSPGDFTDETYGAVAERFFADLEKGSANPAVLVSLFEDPEEQSQVSALFTTHLEEISEEEEAKAFRDILLAVKKNSFEYYSARSGTDIQALTKVIEAKKTLEELNKTHIF
ncbi:MAG: DNA primase [Lachnospiraceae bacterium]|nr:DNA primase [Lachnospiraceae bacterium]